MFKYVWIMQTKFALDEFSLEFFELVPHFTVYVTIFFVWGSLKYCDNILFSPHTDLNSFNQ